LHIAQPEQEEGLVMGRSWLAILVLALALGGAGFTYAEDAQLQRGQETYAKNCSRCHGPEGRGDGPDAGTTRVPTLDLTYIAARRDGVFPRAEIQQIIDGRRGLRAHGPSGMPVWGDEFAPNVSGGGPSEVVIRDQITVLIDYLVSIQRELPAAE
jgi:mono/diheme cytochrome c family protein